MWSTLLHAREVGEHTPGKYSLLNGLGLAAKHVQSTSAAPSSQHPPSELPGAATALGPAGRGAEDRTRAVSVGAGPLLAQSPPAAQQQPAAGLSIPLPSPGIFRGVSTSVRKILLHKLLHRV